MSPIAIHNDSSASSFVSSDDPTSRREARRKDFQDDPVVVVGYAMRFPGGVVDTQSFWDFLDQKKSAVIKVPEDRFALDGWYHPDSSRRGIFYSQSAAFMTGDISKFDAPFFGLSPNEAAALDPQQRILLETTYLALENAGIPMDSVRGTKTSVHVGCFTNDYGLLRLKDMDDLADYDIHAVNASMNANRVSHFFGFRGTSMNIDTACSSSMVALDMACQGLLLGEADIGIVAGTNLIASPDGMIVLSAVNMLSPSGISYSFDSRAHGYGRGEGVGILVLKRLSDALANGDTVRAVIRGAGSAQDGATSAGIMQPSGNAQADLIRETYAKAGLDMSATRYFEAHGTGTPVGDPIEVNSFGSVFRSHRTVDEPLYVGSVKSNIGHLEGGSGVASVIKAIMCLEKGMILPCAKLEKVNPRIHADILNIKFPLETTAWPSEGVRRASVNSFGFGGANGHVILDDAASFFKDNHIVGHHVTKTNTNRYHHNTISNGNSASEKSAGLARIVPLSALSKSILKDLVDGYQTYFQNFQLPERQTFEEYITNLTYTLACRRTLFDCRAFAVVRSLEDLQTLSKHISSPVQCLSTRAIGFIFTGQGAQWFGMGRSMLHNHVFETSLAMSEKALRTMGCPWSLRDELFNNTNTSRISDPDLAQPATTALQIALVDFLRSIGVQPKAVVGHSSGEIGAAYCAGALSAVEAMTVAYYRGYCASELLKIQPRQGAMMATGLGEDEIQAYLAQIPPHEGRSLQIACINSNKSTTIAGPASLIDELGQLLKANGVFARKLDTPMAYHSKDMELVADQYHRLLKSLRPDRGGSNQAVMISSLLGRVVTEDELRTPQYWVDNLTSPVQFSKAFQLLCIKSSGKIYKKLDGSHRSVLGINTLVEIGPHSALQGPVRDLLEARSISQHVKYFSVLKRNEKTNDTMLESLGQLYCLGFPVNLQTINEQISLKTRKEHQVIPDLPAYPFNHEQSYWRESRTATQYRFGKQQKLDLLGRPTAESNQLEASWKHTLKISEMPWIADHVVDGATIYPGAGMLVMAIEAANQIADSNRTVVGFDLKDITFARALKIPKTIEGVETNLLLQQAQDSSGSKLSWLDFRLLSYEHDAWQENCYGRISIRYEAEANGVNDNNFDLMETKSLDKRVSEDCRTSFDHDLIYQRVAESGLDFGPTFRTVTKGSWSEDKVRGHVKVFEWPADQFPQDHVVHPTTLDGILHTSLLILTQGGSKAFPTGIPTGIQQLYVSKKGLNMNDAKEVICSSQLTSSNNRSTRFDGYALDTDGKTLLMSGKGLTITTVAQADNDNGVDSEADHTLYNLELVPDLDLLSRTELHTFCTTGLTADSNKDYFRDLNFVLFKFMHDTCLNLDMEKNRTAQPHLQRFAEWGRHLIKLFQEGTLPLSRPEWTQLLHDEDYFRKACLRVSNANAQGYAFVFAGQNLRQVLEGTLDPLEFLFKDDLLANFYTAINQDRICFDQWHRYLVSQGRLNPSMKILEIGAGTGGTTSRVLRALSETGSSQSPAFYASYDYTDISAAFFENAAVKFEQYPRIEYRQLNIEEDPGTQGFELGTYDIVVAANVLHATTNMLTTMRHVRSLLKDDGKVMMYESTRPEIVRSGCLAGLMSGWWAGKESYRHWGAGISADQWNKILLDTGFNGIDVELPDFEDPECQEAAILISTAKAQKNPAKHDQNIKIIVDPTSSQQQSLFAEVLPALSSRYSPAKVEAVSIAECSLSPDLETSVVICFVETERMLLSQIKPEEYNQLHRIIDSCERILWVTYGLGSTPARPEFSISDGMLRGLRNEKPNGRLVSLKLDYSSGPKMTHVKHILSALSNVVDHTHKDYEMEFVEINDLLHVPRVMGNEVVKSSLATASSLTTSKTMNFGEAGPLKFAMGTTGLLDTLHWVPDSTCNQPLNAHEVEIEVKAVGMNFKDCLIALGQIPGETFGLECSGIILRAGSESGYVPGEYVVALYNDSFRTIVRTPSNLVCKIPEDISFAQAASLPIQFLTAWKAVYGLGRLGKGESILIHAGAGGTGQAAIQIAQLLGAEVFTTVGSQAKKEILMKEYGIPEDHIFYSRDTTFAAGVKSMTKQRGVDVILNSLAGDMLEASWSCIAPYGRFVEIGKKDILANQGLSMLQFESGASFVHFDASKYIAESPDLAKKDLAHIIELVQRKQLTTHRPLHVYSIEDLEKAFRAMQSGTVAGKIVLEMDPKAKVDTIFTQTASTELNPNATYVIAGGLGGNGRAMARWLADRGAMNIVLLGREGAKKPAALELVQELQDRGVNVKTPPCNVIDAAQVRKVFDELRQTMPPIRGCIQSSMVLRDGTFDKMAYEEWHPVVECKAAGSWNLHENLPADIDFFILMSSLTSVIGLPGQANYAAGNTYLDALARYRVSQNLKATSFNLGIMVDDGLLVETEGFLDRVTSYGLMKPISRLKLFDMLDYYSKPSSQSSDPIQSQIGIGLDPLGSMTSGFGGFFLEKRHARHLVLEGLELQHAASLGGDQTQVQWRTQFAAAQSMGTASEIAAAAIVHKLKNGYKVVGEDVEVNMDWPLYKLGLDSLLAIELCKWIGKDLGAELAVFELLGGSTLETVSLLVAARSQFVAIEKS